MDSNTTFPFSELTPCKGTNKVVFELTISGVTSEDTFMLGGSLTLTGGMSIYGNYSTANPSGSPYTIRAVYK